MQGDANRPHSLGLRIAITLGVPVGLLAAARIPAAGVNPELQATLDSRVLGILALGIAPALSAYLTVELVALLIPRLRPLRHGGPAARLKLQRAANVLTVVLAATQAFGMSMYLASLELQIPDLPIDPSGRWLFTGSVCAGACVTLLAARWISSQGLANGFVLITLFETGDTLLSSLLHTTDPLGRSLDARGIAIATASLLLAAAATGLALSTPLLASRQRALVPVPASSVQPFSIGISVLGFPAAFANFFPEAAPSVARLTAFPIRFLVMSAATLASALVLAWLFQRPRGVASVLAAAGAPPVEPEDVTHASRRALLPTLLFLAALLLCNAALERLPKPLPMQAFSALTFMVLLAVVVWDLSRALKDQRRHADLVPIWEERRPYLLPHLRALFVEHGIKAAILHEGQQNLFRFFAPYVAVEIWVPAEARERARELLERHLLGSVKAASSAPSEASAGARREPAQREGLQLPLLAGVAIAALGLTIVAPLRSASNAPTVKLEITRVDDSVDPFPTGGKLPEGVAFASETVGRGVERRSARYLRITPQAGESADAALGRIRPWMRALKLPPPTRLAFGPVDADPNDFAPSTGAGARSYLLTGEPVITTPDITEAKAGEDETSAFIAITLSPGAAARLAQVTREHLHERLAILLDGKVEIAPIIIGEIKDGVVRITLSAEETGALERAEAIARALNP